MAEQQIAQIPQAGSDRQVGVPVAQGAPNFNFVGCTLSDVRAAGTSGVVPRDFPSPAFTGAGASGDAAKLMTMLPESMRNDAPGNLIVPSDFSKLRTPSADELYKSGDATMTKVDDLSKADLVVTREGKIVLQTDISKPLQDYKIGVQEGAPPEQVAALEQYLKTHVPGLANAKLDTTTPSDPPINDDSSTPPCGPPGGPDTGTPSDTTTPPNDTTTPPDDSLNPPTSDGKVVSTRAMEALNGLADTIIKDGGVKPEYIGNFVQSALAVGNSATASAIQGLLKSMHKPPTPEELAELDKLLAQQSEEIKAEATKLADKNDPNGKALAQFAKEIDRARQNPKSKEFENFATGLASAMGNSNFNVPKSDHPSFSSEDAKNIFALPDSQKPVTVAAIYAYGKGRISFDKTFSDDPQVAAREKEDYDKSVTALRAQLHAEPEQKRSGI